MTKQLQNEKGYTLILTVAVIVIFTVLGLSLLTLTSSGIKKNELRQDTVQAQDLSDKGIKYAVNDIQLYLQNEIKNNPMGKTDFYQLLENNIIPNCSDGGGITIPGGKQDQTKETKVCIDRVEMVSNDEKDLYKRLVTFKSTGIVNGKTRITTSKVIIGTDAIPDQLRYALSTNDGGDLYLHGGVEIQGDVKTDGNLIITRNAHWMFGIIAVWENSVGPRLVKDTKSITPKIIMRESGKNIYTVDEASNYDDHISNPTDKKGIYYLDKPPYTKLSPANVSTTNKLKNNYLFNTPNLDIVTKSLPADQIDVLAKIQEKNVGIADYYFEDLTISKKPTENFSRSDTVLVGKKCRQEKNNKCQEYKYEGDMKIDSNHQNINLTGTYYVNGDLTINDTNLKSDALIYVKGDVEIKESTLQGLDPDSTLIIFANGNIQISNISEYSDYHDPSTIKGFFYSKSNMIMYGVGSNIRLTGGISAKRLILTALRGNTTPDWFGINTDSIDEQKKKDSRLKVTYDEDLIQQYTTFMRDQQEEYITELNPPEYIERSSQ
ncbi:hypothetical protein [Rummeliibacillus sp. SL167]|uniref:hypothetical protein n=1 Tax=Rummeliibacillus sp. SL167 TaxID=2579792 RepID=UPI0011B4051B|nr:hypothetical protein [Rummeliibacillus sp. SL167]